MPSLNNLIKVQRLLIRTRIMVCNRFWGMHIHPTARLSRSAKLDRTHPRGLHIGRHSYVAFDAAILTHDMVRSLRTDTVIGDECFIGARSTIMPGVRIGNNAIVAAGSVVTRDVPANTIVSGNPASVLRADIHTGHYGVLRKP
ncbi:acyltransferase [Sphingomonas sp. Mn802worker]|uniref:acyltransferase n=1 Tax=Sphingomonas sp. Mn802worker TaxID=629773 RepID=UPI000367E82B|nr:DapH/DapD/GlmU-related protein [Sphingomonas sp. Mn802worker]